MTEFHAFDYGDRVVVTFNGQPPYSMLPHEANILVGQIKDAIRRIQFAGRRTRRSFHIKDTGEF